MSKFEKYGSIKFSPTAVTDKEEVHGLHKRAEGASGRLFLVTCTVDETRESTENDAVYIKCDRSISEINEAFNAGCVIYAVYGDLLMPPMAVHSEYCIFSATQSGIEGVLHMTGSEIILYSANRYQMIVEAISEQNNTINNLTTRIEALEAAAQTTTE